MFKYSELRISARGNERNKLTALLQNKFVGKAWIFIYINVISLNRHQIPVRNANGLNMDRSMPHEIVQRNHKCKY